MFVFGKFGALTLPKTNSSPLKIGLPKRKGSSSNHPFSGVNSLLVWGRVYFGFDTSTPYYIYSGMVAEVWDMLGPSSFLHAFLVETMIFWAVRSTDPGTFHKIEWTVCFIRYSMDIWVSFQYIHLRYFLRLCKEAQKEPWETFRAKAVPRHPKSFKYLQGKVFSNILDTLGLFQKRLIIIVWVVPLPSNSHHQRPEVTLLISGSSHAWWF